MKSGIKGIEGIDSLKQKLLKRMAVIRSLECIVEIDPKNSGFVPGSFLHQDMKDEDGNIVITEKESAQFEVDNPDIFNFLRNINHRVNSSLEG